MISWRYVMEGNQKMLHPDCMMPDGAEPCLGFQQMDAEKERMRAAVEWFVERSDKALSILHGALDDGNRALQYSALGVIAGNVEQLKAELSRKQP